MKATIGTIMVVMAFAGSGIAGEHPEHPKAKAPATVAAEASVGTLDGQTFVGELGATGAEKSDLDEFIFMNGNFVSTACVQHGFTAAPYTATAQGDAVAFTSAPRNAAGETMSWKGVIKNGAIEGTAVHQTDKGQTEYWFKGAAQAAGSSSKTPPTEAAPKASEHAEHPK